MNIENNKLIAEFMNYKPTFEVYINDVLTTLEIPIKNYHSDWNWLMEVVEKIESIEYKKDLFYNVIIGGFLECSVQDIEGRIIVETIVGSEKIESVYNACVTFIEWYNQNLDKPKN